jgi:hypothetical protein
MVALVALVLAIVFIGYALLLYLRATETISWPKAEATITHVSIKLTAMTGHGTVGGNDMRMEYYLPVIEYTYAVGSRTYKGSRLFPGEIHPMQHGKALELVEPYKEGAKVQASYDRANPGYAVLETRADSGALTVYAVLGVLSLIFAMWWKFA